MAEHLLFLTGKLAEKSLRRVLDSMAPTEFTYEVREIGVSVAALMTADMIGRRLDRPQGFDRIVVPGLCAGDLEALSQVFGIPVVRGPEDLKDLPVFFGRRGIPPDLSRYRVRIFAEIVEAPDLPLDEIVARAKRYRSDGADVIDLGCLPGKPFPHLEDAVQALHEDGFQVSVDSMETDELLRGGKAGADYLLSLKESTLWLDQEVPATPILIPESAGDLESLYRACETMMKDGRPFLADSILDPIHFGFTESVARYRDLRRRFPDIEIMMGTGNLTELTDADTTGVTAILLGIVSELAIDALLTTEVSPHARSVVRETDRARRIMCAASTDNSLPRGYDAGLLVHHERKPFPYSREEIAETAGQIRDPSYRVQISEEGIHVYNRDGMHDGTDPFGLFPSLTLLQNDAPHAFYMGVELARAQVAWQLGKRYSQDEELKWGCALPGSQRADEQARSEKAHAYKGEGSTLKAKKKKKRKRKMSSASKSDAAKQDQSKTARQKSGKA